MSNPGVHVTIYGRTDVGRVRTTNEDALVVADLTAPEPLYAMAAPVAFAVGERGILLAVSDGMGGAQAGEVASALALRSLQRGMTGHANSAEAALQASVERANERVFQAAAAVPGRKGMGATITAVLLYDGRAYVAEVGDSRAYLLRGDSLVQLTHDQSYVQALLDAGTLTREQAATFAYKNVILQALGVQPSVIVALNRFTLRQRDRILLCSDGLTGLVADDELRSIIGRTAALDGACATLIDTANSRGGNDNITVVLAELDGDALPVRHPDGRVSLEDIAVFPAPGAGAAPGGTGS